MCPNQRHSGPPRHQGGRGSDYAPQEKLDTSRITFSPVEAELFNEIADKTAKTISSCRDNNRNKSTQIRKFYDELCMWEEKVRREPEEFNSYLPFIKMLNAKAAYANGRKLVDDNFNDLMEHCMKQVSSAKDLRTCKTFFEAFMGFLKRYRA
ncbi:MAG: type III-A CRISPR-associated protein Csm2 [Planctomycetota bacterium]|jgi:CRISPR-associated protein Csm2|nr:type III-A CRISPR-associated protein Csm2 [Planctomycetota bacterium]